jgi:hypothetical protein
MLTRKKKNQPPAVAQIIYVLICIQDAYIVDVFESEEIAKHYIQGGTWRLLDDIWQNTRPDSTSVYEVVPKQLVLNQICFPEQEETFRDWCQEFWHWCVSNLSLRC